MIARTLYNLLLPLALAVVYVVAWFLPKVREAVAGRRGFRARYRDAAARMDSAPVWFHVASVGEFEQARPVISLIEKRFPHVPVMVTFSSPSGYHFALRRETPGEGAIRFIDYLPADTRGNMRFCLDTMRPRLLVLVKFDLWPNLVWGAKARNIPIVLIAATLSPSSRRGGGPGRRFYGAVYSEIDHILAISDEDAGRFREAAPAHGAISVAGDTRVDRVMERWENRATTRLDIAPGPGPVVIAGSTWPRDEEHLLPALAELLERHPSLRVIVAPHEPVPAHVAPLESWARACGITPARVSAGAVDESARIVILDTIGVLAEAYRLGDIAYVGGSFTTGVHSVLEPAIAGMPVLFGPVHDNSFEAVQLVALGGAFCVRDTREMRARLEALVIDPGTRGRAGEAARRYVESQLGASEKCMAVVARFL